MGWIKDIFDRNADYDEVSEPDGSIYRYCPRCGRREIQYEIEGFSLKDGFVGNLMYGKHGWLRGFRDRGTVLFTCMRCGCQWVEK